MSPKEFHEMKNLEGERLKRITALLGGLSPEAIATNIADVNKRFGSIFNRYLLISTAENGLVEIISTPKLAFERDSDMLLFFMINTERDRIYVFGGGKYAPSSKTFLEDSPIEFPPVPTQKLQTLLDQEGLKGYILKNDNFNDRGDHSRYYSLDEVKILVDKDEVVGGNRYY